MLLAALLAATACPPASEAVRSLNYPLRPAR